MNKLSILALDALDAIVVAFVAAVACVTLIEEWRTGRPYLFVGAWMVGALVGDAAWAGL